MSETPDQAATRRRWVSLAELVAVSGVLIAALTLYLNWSDKRQAAAERAAAAAQSKAAGAQLALHADLHRDSGEVRLSDPGHEALDVTISFPRPLGVAAQSPAVARIERDWFADALLKATDGGPDEREGRLPVLVTARYRDGATERSARAVVEIVWRTGGRLIGGRTLALEAARVCEPGGTQERIDELWKTETAKF